jgi:hypothetical protein
MKKKKRKKKKNKKTDSLLHPAITEERNRIRGGMKKLPWTKDRSERKPTAKAKTRKKT